MNLVLGKQKTLDNLLFATFPTSKVHSPWQKVDWKRQRTPRLFKTDVSDIPSWYHHWGDYANVPCIVCLCETEDEKRCNSNFLSHQSLQAREALHPLAVSNILVGRKIGNEISSWCFKLPWTKRKRSMITFWNRNCCWDVIFQIFFHILSLRPYPFWALSCKNTASKKDTWFSFPLFLRSV